MSVDEVEEVEQQASLGARGGCEIEQRPQVIDQLRPAQLDRGWGIPLGLNAAEVDFPSLSGIGSGMNLALDYGDDRFVLPEVSDEGIRDLPPIRGGDRPGIRRVVASDEDRDAAC